MATVSMEIIRLLEENERLRLALRIIAGREQCLDNLMSNQDVACEALDGKRNDFKGL